MWVLTMIDYENRYTGVDRGKPFLEVRAWFFRNSFDGGGLGPLFAGVAFFTSTLVALADRNRVTAKHSK